MKHSKKENLTDGFAIFLSLAIHGLLLLGAYYLPIRQGSRGTATPYKVELDLRAFHEVMTQAAEKSSKEQVEPLPMEKEKIEPAIKQSISPNSPVNLPPEEITQQVAPTQPEEKSSLGDTQAKQEPPVLDNRGLYKVAEDKKTGASLELVGWTWDFVPHPQDDTNEIGRIVFEVTIDDSGEIIAIKTLEKTVSPLVEQLYKDEVAKLTFSKTNKSMAYAPTSTGKITFILQYK